MTGIMCPLCARRTERIHTPGVFRIFRWILPKRSSYRLCFFCKFRALAVHEPRENPHVH